MKQVQALMCRLVAEDNGGEVLEYALIAGLIVIAAISAITVLGTKVLAGWKKIKKAKL